MEAVDLEHPKGSAPTTATSNAKAGFTSILGDNTQTAYPSYPSTKSSTQVASPGIAMGTSSFSADILQQPQAR